MAAPEQRFVNHVHYILIQRWDPIGVRDEPYAQDEYDGYIPGILGLLRSHADAVRIAQHLYAIETDRTGLPGNLDHDIQIAHELIATYYGSSGIPVVDKLAIPHQDSTNEFSSLFG